MEYRRESTEWIFNLNGYHRSIKISAEGENTLVEFLIGNEIFFRYMYEGRYDVRGNLYYYMDSVEKMKAEKKIYNSKDVDIFLDCVMQEEPYELVIGYMVELKNGTFIIRGKEEKANLFDYNLIFCQGCCEFNLLSGYVQAADEKAFRITCQDTLKAIAIVIGLYEDDTEQEKFISPSVPNDAAIVDEKLRWFFGVEDTDEELPFR